MILITILLTANTILTFFMFLLLMRVLTYAIVMSEIMRTLAEKHLSITEYIALVKAMTNIIKGDLKANAE
jgi:hypothetical protein